LDCHCVFSDCHWDSNRKEKEREKTIIQEIETINKKFVKSLEKGDWMRIETPCPELYLAGQKRKLQKIKPTILSVVKESNTNIQTHLQNLYWFLAKRSQWTFEPPMFILQSSMIDTPMQINVRKIWRKVSKRSTPLQNIGTKTSRGRKYKYLSVLAKICTEKIRLRRANKQDTNILLRSQKLCTKNTTDKKVQKREPFYKKFVWKQCQTRKIHLPLQYNKEMTEKGDSHWKFVHFWWKQ